MKKSVVSSFDVDHRTLKEGLYLRSVYEIDDKLAVRSWDLRFCEPMAHKPLCAGAVHTIEHLGATFLRNHPDFGSKTIYFGPMGCRTGFYLLLAGNYTSRDIVPLMTEMFTFIRDYHDEVPGASPKDCGNYLDMNLSMANYLANRFLTEVLTDIKEDRLVYPE